MSFRGRNRNNKRERVDPAPASGARSAADAESSSEAVPAYHLELRRAVKAVLADDAMKMTAVNDTLENFGMKLEALLPPLCDAADQICFVAEGTPIDVPKYRVLVTEKVKASCSAAPQNMSDVFVEMFCKRTSAALVPQKGGRPRGATTTTQQTASLPPPPPPPVASQLMAPPPPPSTSAPVNSVQQQQQPVGRDGAFPARKLLCGEGAMRGGRGSGSFPSAGRGGGVLPTPPVVRVAPPVQQPASLFTPLVGTVRVVTFENVPQHLLGDEPMKHQLDRLMAGGTTGFRVNLLIQGAFSLAIVSLSSVETANELIAKTSVFFSGPVAGEPPMSARPATAAEIDKLWAERRAAVAVLEQASKAAVDGYDLRSAGTQRAFWHAASDAIKAADEQLEVLDPTDKASGSERLVLLKRKLDARQQQDAAVRALAAIHQPLEGPLESFGSSSANVVNPFCLLFISRLPGKLPDKKFLAFVAPLELELVHVWRDPNVPTTMCCELPSVQAVYDALRLLDCNDFCFNSALLTRKKPTGA
jgi:hypothetical protein